MDRVERVSEGPGAGQGGVPGEPFSDLKRWQLNPLVLFGLIMFSIFSAEVLIMILLGVFTNVPRYALPILDAFLLSVMLFPLLYFLFFRPLSLFVAKCRSQEAERSRLTTELMETRGGRAGEGRED